MNHKIGKYPPPPEVDLTKNFATNLNPAGPPEWVEEFYGQNYSLLTRYPPTWHEKTDQKISESSLFGYNSLMCPGLSLPLYLLPSIYTERKTVSYFEPTFWEFPEASSFQNKNIIQFPIGNKKYNNQDDLVKALTEFTFHHKPGLFYICNPNNPTGHMLPPESINDLADQFPQTLFIIDQTYLLFDPDYERLRLPNESSPDNIIALCSLSKFFCLPGLRIGVITSKGAQHLDNLRRFTGPVRVNNLASEIIPLLIEDKSFIQKTQTFFKKEREVLKNEIEHTCPRLTGLYSMAPFRLFRIKSTEPNPSELLTNWLLNNKGIRVGPGHVYGMKDCVRIRPGLKEDNDYLIEALNKSLDYIK